MDKIIIEGLEIDAIIGVYDWERTQTQKVWLDLALTADLSLAMASDNVSDTIDYAAVVTEIEHIASAKQPELLEHFAQLILTSLFAHFPVSAIELKITKPDILSQVKTVGITVYRERAGF